VILPTPIKQKYLIYKREELSKVVFAKLKEKGNMPYINVSFFEF
tara:strand:- start:272 stop:403 length:132 start_codon:yes stop_codon:yes gene_type:complete